jgi:uncharacterized membrane protein YciS (DUF1049 family)
MIIMYTTLQFDTQHLTVCVTFYGLVMVIEYSFRTEGFASIVIGFIIMYIFFLSVKLTTFRNLYQCKNAETCLRDVCCFSDMILCMFHRNCQLTNTITYQENE